MLSHQETILRLAVAAILGAAVGLERERLDWAAGLRTHMLVCLGAALVMIVSAYGFDDVLSAQRVVLDPSRIAAQVVSGVGFLGAGTILFLRNQVIRGLTTAASLWAVAAVGLAAGSGLYLAGVLTTGLIIAILALMKPVEKWLFPNRRVPQLTILIQHGMPELSRIWTTIEGAKLVVKSFRLRRGESIEEDRLEITLLRSTARETLVELSARLQLIDGVREISI